MKSACLRTIFAYLKCNLTLVGCHIGLKKQPRGQPLYPYALVSVSLGFFRSIGLQSFGSYEAHSASSGLKVETFQYKCSIQSTFWQLQLESRNCSVVYTTLWQLPLERAFPCKLQHFSVQMYSTQSTFWQLQGRLQASWLHSAWGLMSWVSVRYRFGYRLGPCKFMIPQSWFATTTWT